MCHAGRPNAWKTGSPSLVRPLQHNALTTTDGAVARGGIDHDKAPTCGATCDDLGRMSSDVAAPQWANYLDRL
jgi:hypothetical protein